MRVASFSGTFVLTFAIFSALLNPVSCKFATFSEKCDDDQLKCSPEADLNCADNLCQCRDPANMVFEQKRNQCVMLAGRICTPDIGNCVDNADCSQVGPEFLCICDPNSSYENLEGLCPQRREDGQSCTSDKECHLFHSCINGVCGHGNVSYGGKCGADLVCDGRVGLTCSNNFCNCTNHETMIYDRKQSQCVVLVGETCFENQTILGHCVGNAYCSLEHGVGQCHCSDDYNYFQDSEGYCEQKRSEGKPCTSDDQCRSFHQLACVKGTCTFMNASYGEYCGDDLRCDPDPDSLLTCHNNSCQCKDNSIHVKTNARCSVPEGGSCGRGNLGCTENAHCDYVHDFRCRCKDPELFYRSSEGFCIPRGHPGENCTNDNDCRKDIALSCLEGVCSCPQNEYVIDRARRSCARKVGIRCTWGKECVKGAVCEEDKCRCDGDNDYHDADWGLCGVGVGGSCGGEQACGKQLDCVEGKCECRFPLHQFYNSKMSRCVSYVRGPCFSEMNGILQNISSSCVANADCRLHNQTGLLECLCTEGYIEGPDRTCVGTFGQNCTGSGGCDPLAGLKCRNGKCACSQFHKYDKQDAKCLQRKEVGAVCHFSYVDHGDECVEGARCHKFRVTKETNETGTCQCEDPYKPTSNGACYTEHT